MSVHTIPLRADPRHQLGVPAVKGVRPATYVPASMDDRLRLRRLEHQIRVLTAAIRMLADIATAAGEPALAERARRLCDHCDP